MNTPEIEELKSLVEKKFKRILSTTTDFEEFSIELKRKVSKEISSSTLKRIWGYVNDSHKTRKFTLDILCGVAQDKHTIQLVVFPRMSGVEQRIEHRTTDRNWLETQSSVATEISRQ